MTQRTKLGTRKLKPPEILRKPKSTQYCPFELEFEIRSVPSESHTEAIVTPISLNPFALIAYLSFLSITLKVTNNSLHHGTDYIPTGRRHYDDCPRGPGQARPRRPLLPPTNY